MENLKIKILICLIFIVRLSFGQNIAIPKSFAIDSASNSNGLRTAMLSYNLPALINANLRRYADSITDICGGCQKAYYGYGIPTSLDLKSSAQYYNSSIDGGKLWIFKLNSATALGMQFYFNKFLIPENSSVFIYNEDKSTVLGPFTNLNSSNDPNKLIQFGTMPIRGQTIYIEYFEGSGASFSGNISICNCAHLFNGNSFFDAPGSSLNSCEYDVVCQDGVGWEREINSVALIVYYDEDFNLLGQCSGALINNTANDGKPYFLSAAHCINYSGATSQRMYDYSTWQFVFNYNAVNCNSLSRNLFYDVIYGSSLKANDIEGTNDYPYAADYLLLELNADLNYLKNIGVCFSGWTLNNPLSVPSTSYTVIHHPMADFKKITKANNLTPSPIPTFNSYWNFPNFYNLNYTKGVVEPGSSGSPLYNGLHQIIGTVSGVSAIPGTNWCNSFLYDKYYGRFLNQWSQGNFKQWLDPLNQTATSTFGCQTFCPYPSNTVIEIGGPQVVTSPGTYQSFAQGFNINGKSGFPILCQTDNITLTPSIGGAFSHKEYTKSVPCSQATQSGGTTILTDFLGECGGKETLGFYHDCYCWYTSYEVFIEEYDYEMKPTGNEVSKTYEQRFYNSFITSFSFNPSDVGMSLSPGKFYKIGLGQLTNGWDYSSKVIYILPNDLNINNSTVGANLYAMNNLTLQNTTVNSTSQILIEATNKITIKPNSILKVGKYTISPINCGTFRLSTGSDNNSNGSGKGHDNIQLTSISTQDNQSADNKKAKEYTLYPNPASSDVFFELKNQNYSNKYFTVEVVSALGEKVVFQELINYTNLINIKISDLKQGVYFVKIRTDNGAWDIKFVKE